MVDPPEAPLWLDSTGHQLKGFLRVAQPLNFTAEAYVTLWYGMHYSPAFDGIKVLLHSIRQFDRVRPIVIMTPNISDAKANPNLQNLRRVLTGIRLISVPWLRSPQKCRGANGIRLSGTFTSFNVWTLTQFSRVIFVEGDQFLTRSLAQLWSTEFRCTQTTTMACAAATPTWSPIRSCKEFYRAPWYTSRSWVNTGVMLLRPSHNIHNLLVDSLIHGSYKCAQGSQTLFNVVMGPRMQCLPYSYNCVAEQVPLDGLNVADMRRLSLSKKGKPSMPQKTNHKLDPGRTCIDGNNSLPHIVHFLGNGKPPETLSDPWDCIKPWVVDGYRAGRSVLQNHSWPYALWHEHLRAVNHALRTLEPIRSWHSVDEYLGKHGRHGPPDHHLLRKQFGQELAERRLG